MTKELDNMKMWESVIKCYRNYHPVYKGCKDIFDKALIDQGFAFNGEHIVPIENNSDQIGDYDHSKVFEALHANKEALQCKQKPTDKVEPKFKVGDWVVQENIGVYKVIEICKSWYEVIDSEDNHYSISFDKECMCHLWTIQDAKDGDVLSWDDSKCIAIFKNIYDEDSFNNYGFVGHCTGTFELRQSYHDIDGAHPATKEQRDLLFQKMKEAGYEWDAEKKEFNKI